MRYNINDFGTLNCRYDRKEAMTYIMGQGDVIKGCEIGTMKMCKGEKRYLVIPPNLAYGSTQYGQIPPSKQNCICMSRNKIKNQYFLKTFSEK